MPKKWYCVAGVAFVVWGFIIWGVAHWIVSHFAINGHNDKPGRAVELAGTLLTLLPVMVDLFRKSYVCWIAPKPSDENTYLNWANARLLEAYQRYEPLYGIAVFLGVSLIALGFAIDFVH